MTRPDAASALLERVTRLRADVTDLVATDLALVDGANGPALHAELHRVTGQLQALAARVLARVEADGRWSAGGARTFGEWQARKRTSSPGAVRRQVELGRTLESLSATSQAVSRGEVSVEHAQVLARRAATSDKRLAALASDDPLSNESFLLTQAAMLPVEGFRREVDRWATRVDAATADAEHDAAATKEFLTVARRQDGVALTGFLTHEHGEGLLTALRAIDGVPAQDDARSREERHGAALVAMSRVVLDKGLAGGGQQVRPHLLVHVPLETMLRLGAEHPACRCGSDGCAGGESCPSPAPVPHTFDGAAPAELADGRAIAPELLARLACDSSITRVVFGPDSAVLDVGRAKRTYSGQQRLAVIARDKSCRYPGCGAPPNLGEVHHVLSWLHLGETSVENGILLCWYHHDLVHRRGIRIARVGAGWELRRHDGALIGPDGSIAENDLAVRVPAQRRGEAAVGSLAPDGGPPGSGPPGREPSGRPAARTPSVGPPAPAPWGGPPLRKARTADTAHHERAGPTRPVLF